MPVSTKELVGASTQLLVLSVLSQEPSYGYEIVRRINATAGGIFQWQEGTVYPVLHRLERGKLIRAQWQESPSGRRRKYYYITATGRTALAEDARQWGDFSDLVQRISTGVQHV